MSVRGTPYVDRSGTITLGGTAQAFVVANTARKYLRLQNPKSATESLWVNDVTGTALSAAPDDGISYELEPGASMPWGDAPPIGIVSVYGATSTHKFAGAEG